MVALALGQSSSAQLSTREQLHSFAKKFGLPITDAVNPSQANLRTEGATQSFINFVPQTGYLSVSSSATSTTSSGRAGLLLNACLNASDTYIITTASKAMSGTQYLGLQFFLTLYNDPFCTNSSILFGLPLSLGGYTPVGDPTIPTIVSSGPSTSPIKPALWAKQYSNRGATGTVIAWNAFPINKGCSPYDVEDTDIKVLSCSGNSFNVKVSYFLIFISNDL